MENKAASLLVAALGKTFSGILHLGVVDTRQVAGNSHVSSLERFVVTGG